MMETPASPLTPQVASWLTANGLAGVGLALAEHAAPAALLGAQLAYVGQPFLAWVWPAETISQWARWLEDPASLPALAQHLRAAEAAAYAEDNR